MVDKHLSYRKRCEANPFKMYLIAKRGECRKKGIPCDLDPEYLESIWTDKCPVLGLDLARPMRSDTGSGSHQTAHLDRKDPDLGYVKGNVCWMSGRANRIKYNATVEELSLLLGWMRGDTNG